jgi:hypothetical protein
LASCRECEASRRLGVEHWNGIVESSSIAGCPIIEKMCQLLTLLLTAATATWFLFPCANAFIIATSHRQFRSTTFSIWSHVPGGEANPWLSADDGMERGFQAAFSAQPINNRDLQAIEHGTRMVVYIIYQRTCFPTNGIFFILSSFGDNYLMDILWFALLFVVFLLRRFQCIGLGMYLCILSNVRV